MPDITEEEAWELSEIMLRTTPKVGPNGSGFLSRRMAAIKAAQAANDGVCEVAESGPIYQPLRSASQ